MDNKKITITVRIPEQDFWKWVKDYAPEFSSDATLDYITHDEVSKELIVRAKTGKEHTINYLKRNGKLA